MYRSSIAVMPSPLLKPLKGHHPKSWVWLFSLWLLLRQVCDEGLNVPWATSVPKTEEHKLPPITKTSWNLKTRCMVRDGIEGSLDTLQRGLKGEKILEHEPLKFRWPSFIALNLYSNPTKPGSVGTGSWLVWALVFEKYL